MTPRMKPSGVQKGFLLKSASTPRKNRTHISSMKRGSKSVSAVPTTSSSVLLNVSGQDNSDKSNLWVLESANHEQTSETTCRGPLHLSSHDSHQDDEATELLSPRKNALIQEIQPKNDQSIASSEEASIVHAETCVQPNVEPSLLLVDRGNMDAKSSAESEPLLQEVTSRRRIVDNMPSMDDCTKSENGKLTTIKREKTNNGISSVEESYATTSRLVVREEIVKDELRESVSQKLSVILWALKSSKSMNVDQKMEALLDACGTSRLSWNFVWESVLADVAREQGNGASTRLGTMILRRHDCDLAMNILESYLHVDADSSNKETRVVALGATLLVRRFMMFLRSDRQCPSKFWLTQVAPSLAAIASGMTQRSVLSQTCMTAALEIVAVVAEAVTQSDDVDICGAFDIEGSLVWMETLLTVQEKWIQSTIPSFEKENCDELSIFREQARRRCTVAVLHDWRLVLQNTGRDYDRARAEYGNDRTAQARVTKVVCWRLCGTKLDDVESIGGLRQTLSHDSPKLSLADIDVCLQEAAKLVRELREDRGSDEEKKAHLGECLRSVIRGVVSWLGQSKRHLKALQSHPHKERYDSEGLDLLKAPTNEVVDLALVFINHYWSSSKGLPPDLFCGDLREDDSPSTFHMLVDGLKVAGRDLSGREDASPTPTERALCLLVKNCIQFGGPSLFHELLLRNGLRSSTIDVVTTLLSESSLDHHQAECSSQHSGVEDLCHLAGGVLLDNMASHSYVRKKMLTQPELLSSIPLEVTVPKLILALARIVRNTSAESTTTVSAACTCLNHIMISRIPNDTDSLVRFLLDSIMLTAEGDLPKICQAFGGYLRRSLLHSHLCDDYAFGNLIAGLGRAMFRTPANTAPLALLGSIVGDGTDLDVQSDLVSQRVSLCMSAALTESVDELGGPTSAVLCDRLWPLLFLRKLPRAYFQVAWGQQHQRECLVHVLDELACHLAVRLDVESGTEKIAFVREERQLAADVAGRCLPFFECESCSCFHRICLPAFSSLLELFEASPDSVPASSIETMKVAQAALYSVCHHLSMANPNEAAGDGILATAAVVLVILNKQPVGTPEMQMQDRFLLELQRVCIDFVALCMEAVLKEDIRSDSPNPSTSAPLVMEVNVDTSQTDSAQNESEKHLHPLRTSEALRMFCSWIVSTLQGTTKSLYDFHDMFGKYFGTHVDFETTPTARTCLWNGILVMSKSCKEDGGILKAWARRTAPWVLEWGASGKMDLETRHPLCNAAALEVLFAITTRTKDLTCLAVGGTAGMNSLGGAVRRAHKWALEAVRMTSTKELPSEACPVLKRAALKLMLALASASKLADSEEASLPEFLSPGELGETFSILQGAANMDPDEEFHKLATHIMNTLQSTR